MPCMDGMGYTGCLVGIPGIVYAYRKQPGPLFSLLTCGNASYCTPTKSGWKLPKLMVSRSWIFKIDADGKSSKKYSPKWCFIGDFLWYKDSNHLTQVQERIGC